MAALYRIESTYSNPVVRVEIEMVTMPIPNRFADWWGSRPVSTIYSAVARLGDKNMLTTRMNTGCDVD
jgi:hypothetical protein